MRQADFVARHDPEWQALEHWLDLRGKPRRGRRAVAPAGQTEIDDIDFPGSYRRVCLHLALARRRGYSPRLNDRLESLVRRGHDVLYRPPPPRWRRMVGFFASDFPRLVRRHWRYMGISAALFYLPLVAIIALILYRPELAHSLFGADQLAQYERMYDPDKASQTLGRESGTNLHMFGVYVMNNVSIGFRTFASGLIAGIGSIYVLVMNAVVIGGIAGHLTAIGYGGPFWRFVAGHSGPELTSIVLAGGAGLRLGWALLAPGPLTRSRALVEAGRDGAQLILGVFALLLLAAFIEAYWSSIGWFPSWFKFGSGALIWLALGLWLWRGGRGSEHAP